MYTINQAAELTGYHPETLRRLAREGKIKAEKKRIPMIDREVWIVFELPGPPRVGRPKKRGE